MDIRKKLFFFIQAKACLYLVLFIFTITGACAALEVNLSGQSLTLDVRGAPLQHILRQLARQGIHVQIDPDVNPRITASFKNKEVTRALKSILHPLDYALIWESGGAHTGIRLSEIQIFRAGEKSRIRTLPGNQLTILKHPENGSFYVKDEVLIKPGQGMSTTDFEILIRRFGGVILEKDEVFGIYRVLLPENTDVIKWVKQIKENHDLSEAEPNYAYPALLPYRVIDGDKWKTRDTDRRLLSAGSVPIAIFDSGLLPGYGMDELVTAYFDAVNPGYPVSDQSGHGTQMAMIASGAITPSGASAEASEASSPIISVKAFDDNGFTTHASLMRSINFALDHGAKVLSLSWGTSTQSRFLEDAMTYARSRGLFVLASAGNEPSGNKIYPAAYDSVIGVGALQPDGTAWDQSNFGEFVEISAPGFASFPVGHNGEPGTYAGTSISTAYAAKALSAFLTEHPSATDQQARQFLNRLFNGNNNLKGK